MLCFCVLESLCLGLAEQLIDKHLTKSYLFKEYFDRYYF